MSAMASQIISLMIVYSTVYSGTDEKKHQSFASLAFVWGIHRWSVNSPHKGPVTRKCFHLMTSSCYINFANHEDVITWKQFPEPVEGGVELPGIWDAITPMWWHSNGFSPHLPVSSLATHPVDPLWNRPITQIPQPTIPISHNAPLYNKCGHVYTFLL